MSMFSYLGAVASPIFDSVLPDTLTSFLDDSLFTGVGEIVDEAIKGAIIGGISGEGIGKGALAGAAAGGLSSIVGELNLSDNMKRYMEDAIQGSAGAYAAGGDALIGAGAGLLAGAGKDLLTGEGGFAAEETATQVAEQNAGMTGSTNLLQARTEQLSTPGKVVAGTAGGQQEGGMLGGLGLDTGTLLSGGIKGIGAYMSSKSAEEAQKREERLLEEAREARKEESALAHQRQMARQAAQQQAMKEREMQQSNLAARNQSLQRFGKVGGLAGYVPRGR